MNPFTYGQSTGGGDTELQQLAKTDRNPIQETRYQQLLGQNGGGASGGNPLVQQAQQLNDYYKTANQPQIQALGSQSPTLKDQYTQLVNTIKAGSQTSANAQTLTTANELGRRGLTSNSGLYQQDLTNALLPVNSAFSGQLQQANQGSITDLNNLALQIAQLQSGNPAGAVQGALSYGGILGNIQAAQEQAKGYIGAAQANPYEAFGSYGQILNKQTGAINSTGIAALIKALNGGF